MAGAFSCTLAYESWMVLAIPGMVCLPWRPLIAWSASSLRAMMTKAQPAAQQSHLRHAKKKDDVRGRTCDIETLGRGKEQKIVRKRKQEKKAKT